MEKRLQPAARQRDDGSWLVDALIPIEHFEKLVKDFPLEQLAERNYETFGGFITNRLGHVPEEGESFDCGHYTVEVIDMDNHRVDKVLLLNKDSLAGKRST
jgi:putative hemolysin